MQSPADLDALFATVDRKDTDGFLAYLTPDAVFRYGSQPPLHGHEAIRGVVDGIFSAYAGLAHEFVGRWQDGDDWFLEGRVTYTFHDGRTLTIPFLNRFVMRGGQIAEYLIFIDPTPTL